MTRAAWAISSTAEGRTISALGLIAEDETDFLTIRVLVHRMLGPQVKVLKRVGNGCSRIKTKAGTWLQQLGQSGCAGAIVLHDLDRNPMNSQLNDESVLRRHLEAACAEAGVRHLICIPVEEIEAWFWADDRVVKKVGRGSGNAHPEPARMSKPKEALIRLSLAGNGKPRYTTNENPDLAQLLDLETCAARCPSFSQLTQFLTDLRPSLR